MSSTRDVTDREYELTGMQMGKASRSLPVKYKPFNIVADELDFKLETALSVNVIDVITEQLSEEVLREDSNEVR